MRCDGLSFSSLILTFKLLQVNTWRKAPGVLGHLAVHFKGKHIVAKLVNVNVHHFTLCIPPPFLPEGKHSVYVSLC
jgi:hypothetical protein